MTKNKNYKLGQYSFKTYFKPVGKGFEIGLIYKNRNYFTSNFINKTEATKWWMTFNKEILTFSKKYWLSNEMPFQWFCTFMTNHLYKCYYNWLDKVFYKNEFNFKNAYQKDLKKFMKFKQNYNDQYGYQKAA